MEKNDKEPISITFEPEALIIGGGDFPVHPIPRKLIACHDKIVYCDGAANQWEKLNKRPWRIVGDGDSLSDEIRETFKDIIRLDPDQETNDQTKAVTYLQHEGFRKIVILAATGRREDHTLGNISLLMEYMKQGLNVRIYTDHGVFIPCCNEQTFRCEAGTAVSVFSFGTQRMTSSGLAYPLYDFTSLWQGTLNHTTEEIFTISCEGQYLVYLSYENKKLRDK